jgi:hypothetical protein
MTFEFLSVSEYIKTWLNIFISYVVETCVENPTFCHLWNGFPFIIIIFHFCITHENDVTWKSNVVIHTQYIFETPAYFFCTL